MKNRNLGLEIQEIKAKSILSKSGIPGVDYCLNPYVGCSHACRYCYATFMKRFSGHLEPWGTFVDDKTNAPEVLSKQIGKAAQGRVMISSVTDPYQPLEGKYKLTRQCLEILLGHQFPVDILTKSPLVLRDMDLIKKFKDLEVGMTITTDDEKVRTIFEPHAPPIEARIRALKTLYDQGINTYVFIGPLLPMNPEAFLEKVSPYVHSVLIDQMNYVSKTQRLYKQKNMTQWLDEDFVEGVIRRLRAGLNGKEVSIC